MAKILPDTNVLIDTPDVLYNKDFEFVIPYTVLAELDGLKKNQDLRIPAQNAIRTLWAVHRDDPKRVKFVDIPNQITTNDEKIVASAKTHKAKLLSSDIGANVIAEIMEVDTAYDVDDATYDKDYVGYREITLDYKEAANLIGINEMQVDEAEQYFGSLIMNEYVYYLLPNEADKYAIWRLDRDNRVRLVRQSIKPYTAAGFHFVPNDPTQACALDAVFDTTTPLTIIEGRLGTGKAQPLTAVIHTPAGPTTMGAIQVGDYVIGSNGKPTKVLGVYPQGVKPAFRVTLQDGSSTVCCDEHLWTVRQTTGSKKWKTLELKQMINDYKKVHVDNRYNSIQYNYKYQVPSVLPVEYEEQQPLPLDPYLLGALIGGGSLSQFTPAFTTVDNFLLQKIERKLPANVSIKQSKSNKITYYLSGSKGHTNPLSIALRSLGVNVLSNAKSVPTSYKYGSVTTRIQFLQGLMDTDGCVNRNGGIEYTTVSNTLALDVQSMIRSLGGKATLTSRYPKFTHKGERRVGQLAYRLHINMQNSPIQLFSLPRKLERITCDRSCMQTIADISYVGELPMQCIMVEADDHLYVTDDYIVTHNTLISIVAALARTCGQHQYQAYRKIYVTRPPLPVDRQLQLGFLPGDLDAKMGAWLHGIKSNLKFLYERTKKDQENEEAEKIFAEYFEAVSLENIQGMNFHDSILLVDEYTLTSVDVLKQILSRIAEGSKVVLIGDGAQTYGANRGREGYKKLAPHIKGNPLVSYIKMTNIYRSELAEFVEGVFQ